MPTRKPLARPWRPPGPPSQRESRPRPPAGFLGLQTPGEGVRPRSPAPPRPQREGQDHGRAAETACKVDRTGGEAGARGDGRCRRIADVAEPLPWTPQKGAGCVKTAVELES